MSLEDMRRNGFGSRCAASAFFGSLDRLNDMTGEGGESAPAVVFTFGRE